MEEEIKKTEYKDIYELEQECISLTTDLKKRGMYKGFKDTLTKLYTKSGHFVFELIQNAEDCDAQEIMFDLKKDGLVFKHDGKKLFTLENVDAITNVGNSTKNDNGNSIGKFGVGFKSVFEYTNTPEIHSGEYHFVIIDMYIPHPIEKTEVCSDTVFNLPFDIPGKSKKDCFNEIAETLKNLNPETLLFLNHIKKIVCRINSKEIILERKNASDFSCPKNLCTLSKYKAGGLPTNTNYIRFFSTIKVIVPEKDENDEVKKYEKEIKVGIAFKAQLNEKFGWSITPIIYNNVPAGKVFTFFPCEAEKSGLCFHIHAPFALTVDREKLRNEAGNEVIKNKIVDLLISSLTTLKEDELLNMDFLKTLPNREDNLGANKNNNYEMFKRIFEIFDNEPFTPMENGSYEPAEDKYRSKNRIGSLFSDEDMNRLYGTEGKAYWIKNPRQLNQRDDKFIQSLSCKNYNLNNFLDDYSEQKEKYDDIKESLKKTNFVRHDGIKKMIARFEKISEIFSSKKSDWFCKFYLQLQSMISDCNYSFKRESYIENIKNYPFCYCSDSKLYNFSQCYIPSKDLPTASENIHFLNSKICDEVSKNDNLNAFFDSIELKEYSETEIFKNDFSNFLETEITVEAFISVFRKCRKLPSGIDSFSSDFFNQYSGEKFLFSMDGQLCAPNEIYLSEIYGCKIKNIGLYFSSLKNTIKPLSDKYLKLLNDDESEYFKRSLINFGCKDSVEIYETKCSKNRHWDFIWKSSLGYGAGNSQPTSIDFNVEGLEEFLAQSSFEKFEFVWSFLQNTTINRKGNWWSHEEDTSYCYYRTAQKYELKKYSSELRNILVESKWVAQKENGSINFVTPAKAYISKLPEYHKNQFSNKSSYSNLANWFDRINFGKEEKESEEAYQHQLEEEKKQKEELEKLSQSVGFSLDTLSNLKQAKNEGLITEDELKEIINDFINNRRKAKQDREELLNNNSNQIDEQRVSEKALKRYDAANDISSEKKQRSIRTTNIEIKELAKSKLRNRYTSQLNGNMLCQICQNPMPFKDKSDNYYFVTRQLFSSKIFEKELDENYIALCPTCDAKYKVYMAQDEEKQQELKQAIIDSKTDQTEFVISLDYDYQLHFQRQHIISLYSCLSGVEVETPKKVKIILHKKSETQKIQKNNNSKAFCINCKTTFEFILKNSVISCPNCKTKYKNSNGILQSVTNSNRGDIFFDCPYCHKKIQKIHRENHIEKCRKKHGV